MYLNLNDSKILNSQYRRKLLLILLSFVPTFSFSTLYSPQVKSKQPRK